MNKERRKQLQSVIEALEGAKETLDVLNEEEREYYDNMPESIQNGEKGERSSECIDSLDNAISELEDVIYNINQAIE